MRAKQRKLDWTILAVAVIAAVITLGVVAAAAPESADTSRVVSVQRLPENMDQCTWDDSAGSDPSLMASLQQNNLFSALQQEQPLAQKTSATDEPSAPQNPATMREPSSTQAISGTQAISAMQQLSATPQLSGAQRMSATNEASGTLMAELQSAVPNAEQRDVKAISPRLPVRTIRDTAPTYSSVAVDINSNEVILQDNNLWSYRVFDRLSPTPKNDDQVTKPKRIVMGDKTALQFNNGLYVDPVSGDIYSVESDVGDKMVRFPREADGNVVPKAILHTPHRVYNLAADESKGEIFATVEFAPQVVVYRKDAAGEEQPLRHIAGDDTGLDSPHGIAVDEKDRLLFVNTWGQHSNYRVAGTGKYYPPAIKVYPLDASGNAKPLRVITGDKTEMDWPAAMKFNPDNGDLYVANDIGGSVLVFGNAAIVQGDVAPVRVIKGPSTRLRNPTGVALDRKNQELWVSNLGNSSATVYPLMASGDVAPLRIIRSAEESKRGVNFGRTAAVTYDPIRQEILVPNCVNHPQIAVFARSAKEDTPYLRAIEGQKSMLGRTMHDLAFDAIHDEIVVTGPLAQAILSFRGAASGEEPPLRVIQGNKTQIKGEGALGKVSIDPVHNEILLATADGTIIAFDRLANGNVAPKRVLGGPDTQLTAALTHQNDDGSGSGTCIRIDPIHNLLLVPSPVRRGDGNSAGAGAAARGGGRRGGGGPPVSKILIFDRTASGNTPPKAVIDGPIELGNQFEIYAPKLRLVSYNRKGDVEIWKIPESGESSEPPLIIPAPPIGRYGGEIGIVLDPLHKEVIIATASGNTVVTYSVPEVFD